MKKILLIIPLSILFSSFFIVYSRADYHDINWKQYNVIVIKKGYPGATTEYEIDQYTSDNPIYVNNNFIYSENFNGSISYYSYNKWFYADPDPVYPPLDHNYTPVLESSRAYYAMSPKFDSDNLYGVIGGILDSGLDYDKYFSSIHDYDDQFNPEPDEPEPGSDWLVSVWEWVLWQLGLNDDYSGDIDAYITGGDRERFVMVTPSPTPSPTPVPSPTPYTLDIIDNNGNPVYTITGIPGYTYNITNTTNNNDGSDFDIFEVDLQIGDGGSVNPRDGLNDVMDTSKDYLSENVDTSLIGDLFSVIPNDWFLFIGVLAALPFIAGFISKLLK